MQDAEDVPQAEKRTAVRICAVGASAGGTEALRTFFRQVRTDLGLAYIVVIHLAPDHPSALADILSSVTAMPVIAVPESAKLERDHIFVVPPNRELVISDGTVQARKFDAPRGRRAPIDTLFASVSAAQDNGFAVVLSGEGTDGTNGARALREAGGMVLVQDPGTAAHSGMPGAVVSSGCADVIAPLEQLAAQLESFAAKSPVQGQPDQISGGEPLRVILNILHRRLGYDFSQYKEPTILRRVSRRMQLTQQDSLTDYAAYLKSSEDEQKALFSELLISVTSFFRDPSAFEAIAKDVVQPIFDRLKDSLDPQIRVWSAGCATGDEAYSLAMLLVEAAEQRNQSVSIQIFASDIDQIALAKAREGVFGRDIEAGVSPARLKRFFVEQDGGWRVRRELRDMILFAQHSVIQDPPFIHLDIVSCRNLLIYLDRDIQRRVMGVLNYALNPGGFLVLGTAETVDSATDLFRPINREYRIYAAQPVPSQRLSDFQPVAMREPRQGVAGLPAAPTSERGLGQIHLSALESATPPSILVGANRNALHFSPGAGRFLQAPGGPASLDLATMVRPELRLDLGYALGRALGDGEATFTEPVAVAFNSERHRVAMYIAPYQAEAEDTPRALVVFLEGGTVPSAASFDRDALPDDVRRMVQELGDVRDRLAKSRNENEFAMQELRAANEELQSMNEEYRSTSEELETSKEELQSMNEELQTVNDELNSKLESISAAHSDLRNLVDATDYATLFLDSELRIRFFTPKANEVFKLADGDVGRSITDFASTIDVSAMADRAKSVLRTLIPADFNAEAPDGRWYTIRLRPYRTIDDRVDGVVITFVDVTKTHDAAALTRDSEERFATLLRATTDVSFRMGPDWSEMRTLQSGAFLTPTEAPRRNWLEAYIPQEDRARVEDAVSRAIAEKGLFEVEHRVFRTDGSIGWVRSRAAPIFDPDGSIREWFGIATDETARKRAEEAQELLANWHRDVDGVFALVRMLAQETRKDAASLEAFASSFEGRLDVLVRAHDALARNGWKSVGLSELLEQALSRFSPTERERIWVSGPEIALSPNAGIHICLALSELCSNALKYGALSSSNGRVAFSWRIETAAAGDASRLAVEWRESGGPPVQPPDHRGFGSRLLEDLLPRNIGGTARLNFDAAGMVYSLVSRCP